MLLKWLIMDMIHPNIDHKIITIINPYPKRIIIIIVITIKIKTIENQIEINY